MLDLMTFDLSFSGISLTDGPISLEMDALTDDEYRINFPDYRY